MTIQISTREHLCLVCFLVGFIFFCFFLESFRGTFLTQSPRLMKPIRPWQPVAVRSNAASFSLERQKIPPSPLSLQNDSSSPLLLFEFLPQRLLRLIFLKTICISIAQKLERMIKNPDWNRTLLPADEFNQHKLISTNLMIFDFEFYHFIPQ